MPLEIRQTSKWWYGRFVVDGKRYCVNLGVKVPVRSRGRQGEPTVAFIASKAVAQTKLDAAIEEAQSKQGAVRLIEKIYEIKTGAPVESVPLSDIPGQWCNLPRKRKPSPQYMATCCATLERFCAFIVRKYPGVGDVSRVNPIMGRSFLDSESSRGVAAKTWNDTLLLLRSVFRKLLPRGAANPFADIPTREVDTIFRRPFDSEELSGILRAAEQDPELKPVIIAGICTAMRRRDCCMLKWKDLDLEAGFLRVRTNKTRELVDIPILPLLRSQLLAVPKDTSPFVFPQIAAKYQQTPLNISRRVRRVLAAAGFRDQSCRREDAPGPLPKH